MIHRVAYHEHIKTIDNLTLKINGGDHIGIIGTTGSGKSTFINLLLGLLKPSLGFDKVFSSQSIADKFSDLMDLLVYIDNNWFFLSNFAQFESF